MFDLKSLIKNYIFKKKLTVDVPTSPYRELPDIWLGNQKNGKNILINKNLLKKINGFDSFNFLRDLKSLGKLETRSIARNIVEIWINKNKNFFSVPFQIMPLSKRIVNICFTYSWFAKSGNQDFKKKLLTFLSQQLKIQEFKIKSNNNEDEVFEVYKSLIIGNIFLFGNKEKIIEYLKEIESVINRLILKDGGHVSRNPMKQLCVLRGLIEIRSATATLPDINNSVLHKNVKLMSKFFKMFCMPDGNFCFFNGGSLINKVEITETLKRIDKTSRKTEIADASGYGKLIKNNVLLLIDLGTKNNHFSDEKFINKASIGAFELYYKKLKLITNLGDIEKNKDFNSLMSLASTAAHSTLSIDDRNNIDLSNNRKLDYLNVKKNINNLGDLIEIEHSGYNYAFGVNHKRTIFLKKNGLDFRGIDEIFSINNFGIIPKEAKIRFHLSSNLNVFKLRNGKILLKHSEGLIFYFLSSHDAKIEKTTIFHNNKRYNSNQIIIDVSLSDIKNMKIKKCNWSFKFEK